MQEGGKAEEQGGGRDAKSPASATECLARLVISLPYAYVCGCQITLGFGDIIDLSTKGQNTYKLTTPSGEKKLNSVLIGQLTWQCCYI